VKVTQSTLILISGWRYPFFIHHATHDIVPFTPALQWQSILPVGDSVGFQCDNCK